MSQYTEQVTQAVLAVEKAEEAVANAKSRLDKVRNHCGQQGYNITINGVAIAVSTCDSRTYQGTLIRGREMIHLGALKALGYELDDAEKRLKKAQEYLRSVVI